MMGMSVSWSVLRVATQVHGMIQAADGWMFLPHQRIIFVERTLPCAPKPPQPSQASLSPFFIFQVALKALETTPAELAHYPRDAEGCCHGTAVSPPSQRFLGGFTAPYLDRGSGSLTRDGPSGIPGGCTKDLSSLSLQCISQVLASLCHSVTTKAPRQPLCSLPVECEGCPGRRTEQGCGCHPPALSLSPSPIPPVHPQFPSAWLPPVLG